jgi:hypothetical protein
MAAPTVASEIIRRTSRLRSLDAASLTTVSTVGASLKRLFVGFGRFDFGDKFLSTSLPTKSGASPPKVSAAR